MKSIRIVSLALAGACLLVAAVAAAGHVSVIGGKDGGSVELAGDGGKAIELAGDGGKAVELAGDGGKTK